MFSRRKRQRAIRFLAVAMTALVLHLTFPIETHIVHAATVPAVAAPDTDSGTADQIVIPSRPLTGPLSLPDIKDRPVKKRLVLRASAYSSDVRQTDATPDITAFGTRVHDGIIATNCLPYGTQVRIPVYYGQKVFTVEDRMNAKWGCARIDIWMPDRHQAIDWGVRTIAIEIV